MTEEEEDRARDELTQQLIGFLTGAGVLADTDEDDEQFREAVGQLAIALMPNFEIQGRMTEEELSDRISFAMAQQMVQLLSVFAFLFGELAKVNDSDVTMSSAEVLQTISANINNLRNDS
ncbi:hypothetical protein ACFYY2_29760 [Streptomyces sp. NPDC001822]|uniref:hypothetical protein n=1 Tax=Streptomyces sp. NPDC001822 TaxID=3364614 RepID=UPI00369222FA